MGVSKNEESTKTYGWPVPYDFLPHVETWKRFFNYSVLSEIHMTIGANIHSSQLG